MVAAFLQTSAEAYACSILPTPSFFCPSCNRLAHPPPDPHAAGACRAPARHLGDGGHLRRRRRDQGANPRAAHRPLQHGRHPHQPLRRGAPTHPRNDATTPRRRSVRGVSMEWSGVGEGVDGRSWSPRRTVARLRRQSDASLQPA
eukprot:6175742-Pleurochrysis_carterae.AAC.1